MRCLAPLLFCLLPAIGQAGEATVQAACYQRALATAEGCRCLQSLADETVREGLHDLIAINLGKQINLAAIAAERGHSGAEQLVSEHFLFRRRALAQCAINLPEG